MKKTLTTGKMKKRAWFYFSQYIRLRDCLRTTGTLEWGKCTTCNTRLPFKELQAGHVIDGRSGMNFLDERGVFAQCYGCNCPKHGNKEVFIPWFLHTYGKPLFEELMRLKRTPCLWSIAQYEQFIDEIKTKIEYIKTL